MTHDDAGPAFPFLISSEKQSADVTTFDCYAGMNLRDYFAAHAPFRPADWFKPKMPAPRPKAQFEERLGVERAINQNELDDFDKEFRRQKDLQWPYAWADYMLEARKK
jgi:hypothetical protein